MSTISKTSPDLLKERLEQLKKLFPDLFTNEGQLNEEELKALVAQFTILQTERYEFRWAGKAHSKKLAFTPSKATLVPDEKRSVDFNNTENLIIEGDNLEVLKLLQKSYFNKIKMIYVDPPYNIDGDRVYSDDFSENKKAYWEKGNVIKDGVKLDTNTEANGRYHSGWLNMINSRLLLARGLLKDSGVIFISIDDVEDSNLRKLMDEIFGEDNFVAQFIHKNNSTKNQAKLVSISTEYVFCYAKDLEVLKNEEWRIKKKGAKDIAKLFNELKDKGVSLDEIETEIKQMYSRPKYTHLSRWNKIDDYGVFKDSDLSREGGPKDYTINNPNTGKPCIIPTRGWGKSYEELLKLQEKNLIWYGDESTPPGMKDYITKDDYAVPDSFFYFDNSVDTRMVKDMFGALVFENPKPLEMIKQIITMSTQEGDIVLDFFAGSGTTGHAVIELNRDGEGKRKYIQVQLPESTDENSIAYKLGFKTVSQICIERTKRAGDKVKKENEKIDTGFKVFKLTYSHFPENLFTPDPDKSEEENVAAFNKYLQKVDQQVMFDFEDDKLLYEIALKDGFNLNFKIETLSEFDKNKVVKINDDVKEALVCLDQVIADTTVELLQQYKEKRFICLKRAVDTTKKWNLQQLFEKNLWVA